ncbi:MAG: DHA2 family efflux MFS transporter permease subunit [Betaproteobacteria bacterium]
MDTRRLYITLAVMSATVMQVLDTTIVNVALPHMSGELGATSDSISWVLTSYIVAASIFMPLTGYLSDRLGRRRYLMISIGGFVIASVLCGLSNSLAGMVGFRILQGVFGASLVPLSQSIMIDTYPIDERGKAMAIWGMGVMVAPVLGPTLGGYLTEIISWRWTFFINIPVGIVSLLLAAKFVPDTGKKQRSMDWTGLALLSLAIGAMQLVLDRGNQEDWFDSVSIRVSAFLAVAGLALFIANSLMSKKQTLFDLRVFTDRNFVAASILSAAMGLSLYGGMLLQPLMLENVLGYPTMDTGLAMMPRGLASMMSMMLVGKMSGKVNAKSMIAFGIAVSIAGSYLMTGFNLNINSGSLMLPLILQGFGIGFIFAPLSAIAFSTLPRELATEGAGIYSLIRSLGSSIGISLVTTYFTRSTQANWDHLRGFINPFNPALAQYLAPLHLKADSTGLAMVAQQVGLQAQMGGLIATFWLITASFLVMIPLLMLLKPGKPSKDAPVIVAD